MRTLKLMGHVSKDHTLQLELPVDVDEGPAEVIVLLPEKSLMAQHDTITSFLKSLSNLRIPTRSKEEIDRYLQEERNSWEH